MANRSVTYNLYLNSNVREEIQRTEASAKSFDNTMGALQVTMAAVWAQRGVSIIRDWGEAFIQTAADMESAQQRIKFASENVADGAKNIQFIGQEIDKYKVPIQDATDAYGKFLAMIKGSGTGTAEADRLYDRLLLISKVKFLDSDQLNAGVMNLGKMLEAGAMDARHLRPLEQQLSGIAKYIADEMGTSIQHLAVLRNTGKLTGIDPRILLKAVEHQATDLTPFVGEATTNMQSQINDAANSWTKFKIDVGQSTEFREILADVRDLTHWIRENREEITTWAHNIGTAIKYFIEWRVAILALNAPFAIMGFFKNQMDAMSGAVGRYKMNAADATASTNILSNAQRDLGISTNSNIGYESLYSQVVRENISITNAEAFAIKDLTITKENFLESIYAEKSAIEANAAAIMQSSMQMDMFTEAQLQGSFGLQELRNEVSQATSQMLLFGETATQQMSLFTDSELALTATTLQTTDVIAQMGLAFDSAMEAAIISARGAGSAWTLASGAIGVDFNEMRSEAVIAGDSIMIAFTEAAEETALAWDGVAASIMANMATINEATMAASMPSQFVAAGNTARGASSSFMGAAGAIIRNGAMAVFIADMAFDVAKGFGMFGNNAKEWGSEKREIGFADLFAQFWNGVANETGSQEGTHNAVQQLFNRHRGSNTPTLPESMGVKDPRNKLYDKGYDLMEDLLLVQRNSDKYYKEHPTDEFAKKFANNGWIKHVVGSDVYGNIPYMRNDALKGIAEKKGWDVGDLYHLTPNQDKREAEEAEKSALGGGKMKLPKDVKSGGIKGNSITNITIHIDKMVGVEGAKFTITGKNVDPEDLHRQVGDHMVRIMAGVVNDSQEVKQHN